MSGHVDNPLRDIGLNIVAVIVFCCGDTIAKHLSDQLAIVQITWMRYIVFTLMALLLTTRFSGASFRVQMPWMQIARGMCLVSSSLLFILGIRDIGLAEAAAIGFIGPIMVTLLSIPLLGERVEARRWLALAGGMAGVLVVLRPGIDSFQPEALYRVGSALCWAAGVILTRRMAAVERPETTMFWSALSGLIALSAIIPFQFVTPTPTQLGLALAQGIFSSLGQWMVILSLRLAAASVLAPYSYAQLLWTTIAGYLAFGDLPDSWTLLGAALIVATGLYTASRERRGVPQPLAPAIVRPTPRA